MKENVMNETLSQIGMMSLFMGYIDIMITYFSNAVADEGVLVVSFVVMVALNAALAYWARREFEFAYEFMLEEEA